jgi:hypothetical protein
LAHLQPASPPLPTWPATPFLAQLAYEPLACSSKSRISMRQSVSTRTHHHCPAHLAIRPTYSCSAQPRSRITSLHPQPPVTQLPPPGFTPPLVLDHQNLTHYLAAMSSPISPLPPSIPALTRKINPLESASIAINAIIITTALEPLPRPYKRSLTSPVHSTPLH